MFEHEANYIGLTHDDTHAYLNHTTEYQHIAHTKYLCIYHRLLLMAFTMIYCP